MSNTIVKRDGRVVEFDSTKIENAILKAFIEVDGSDSSFAHKKAKTISHYIKEQNESRQLDIEEIQDMVENGLMATNRKDVARAYIIYRNRRSIERQKNTNLIKLVNEKLSASNVENQNANIDEFSFGGRKGEALTALMKELALNDYMPEKIKNNHISNRIYQHDLDSWAVGCHNCLSMPLDDLLKNGFNTRQTDVRGARSINTAFQLVAVLFQLQSLQQFGGVSATHLDWTMVPYFRISLFKHYIMEYIKESEEFEELDELDIMEMSEEEFDDWCDEIKEEYLEKMGLKEEDFFIGSTKLDKRLYKRALFETRKETYQAVEGLYHNLNTLQSRSLK